MKNEETKTTHGSALSRTARIAAIVDSAIRVRLKRLKRAQSGQGTTEYAILVGVIVVVGILAIVAFRPKLQELWDAVVQGMSQL